MNNEEKILEALCSVQSIISNMNIKMDKLSDQIADVEIHLQNVTDKNIGLLMEQ